MTPSAPAIASGTDAGVADRCELNEAHTVGAVAAQAARDLERQPRLADSSDPGERDEAVRAHDLDDIGDELVAADDRRSRSRQVLGHQVPHHGCSLSWRHK